MQINFLVIGLAALIPMAIGFIWYHPRVLGTVWMNESGMTPEKAKGANMPVLFGLSLLFALFISLQIHFMVIHQSHLTSILVNEPGFQDPDSEVRKMLADFLAKYGRNFRTFKHGAFHGFLVGLFMALPIVGTNALFERKSFKYILIHSGYWIVSFMLMGGVICAFA